MHNMIKNEINLTFKKSNHIISHHHVVKVFFEKFICRPNIF